MHVLMVTDAYPPMRTSCAVQMHGLALAFIEEGHQVTVITPASALENAIQITHADGVRLVQVKAFETKDTNYLYRTFAEFINPSLIWHKLKKSPEFLNTQYDGIIWYSPTIFWGPLIKRLKEQYKVKAYLILRDIFPDWALDLGLIKKGLAYNFLKKVEIFQYEQADIIGVQSPNNLQYFSSAYAYLDSHIEVLWNWIGKAKNISSGINLDETLLKNKIRFVYAGNMGKAQDMESVLNLAKFMENDASVGFVLIGRGSEMERIKIASKKSKLANIIFFNEIGANQILDLLEQCDIGLISLEKNHKTHNIPGKFLSYLQAGLPVFAILNTDNDLLNLIPKEKVGRVWVKNSDIDLGVQVNNLISDDLGEITANKCKMLADIMFSGKKATQQITRALLG